MAELSWGEAGQRQFETGVDRGVLFVRGAAVAWNGLTAVNESPKGGEANPYYADGLKYLNLSSMEEFEATIEAWGAPPEFDECLGIVNIGGLSLSGQKKESFALSYRTRIGNEIEGIDFGYKIHIIYGAIATPSEVQNATLSDSPEPVKYSWSLTALPQKIEGFMPSAHFVIDTRVIPADLLRDLEAVLYGSINSDPWIPPASYFQNMIDGSTWIEVIAVHDDGSQTDELLRVHKGATAPELVSNSVIWLDMSGGDYATLKLVSGD